MQYTSLLCAHLCPLYLHQHKDWRQQKDNNMHMTYRDLQARPLKPNMADRYWANPTFYHRQAVYAACAVILILANVIG